MQKKITAPLLCAPALVESGDSFSLRYLRERAKLEKAHSYRKCDEHDSCGIGLVAAVDGVASRKIVEMGIEALCAVWHRGAVDADGKTGDGAGIHVEIAHDFFKTHIVNTGHQIAKAQLAVGMIFLPRTDFSGQEKARSLIESEILREGYRIYGWRQVPIRVACLGAKSASNRPEIEQILLANTKGVSKEQFERELYLIRRRIEKCALAENLSELYVCSLSCRSVIYKGMFLAEHLTDFYPDLESPEFISRFAIFHQRYSTNTFPQWRLAQPFRVLAHNGEINTLRGNVNWMKSHEIRIATKYFGADSRDVKPIIQPDSSDSAALDAVFEILTRAGRSAAMVKTLLIPPAWSKKIGLMPEQWRATYAYCNAVMEPWDGPAAIAASDGKWVIAGMDRNGLRPMRYALSKNGILVAGSEIGMCQMDEGEIRKKGRVGPGELIAVDLEAKKFYLDHEIKDKLAAEQPYNAWISKVRELDQAIETIHEPVQHQGDDLRCRQYSAGFSLEDIELILHPMVVTGKEATGSMGDDTPLAVLSGRYRSLSSFFRQNFSQVTNPPIDSLREDRVMSLKTRFGNLGNVLAETPHQMGILTLESPVVSNGMFANMLVQMGQAHYKIDCTFPRQTDPGALQERLEKIRLISEDAVRQGYNHLILSDEQTSEKCVPVPMILAAGGIHSHLVKQGLRTFCSINVRDSQCLDPHHFAVLIGVGATTVNAYLAEATIAERQSQNVFGKLSHKQCILRYHQAINAGLMKIIAKMGISVISSYRGGYNFEAVGLSRALTAAFFPSMLSRISGIGLAGIEEKIRKLHTTAYHEKNNILPIGGLYRIRASGEHHAMGGQLIHLLRRSVTLPDAQAYQQYTKAIYAQPPTHLRDLLSFRKANEPISLARVESVTAIRKRFVTPGMSLGALSPEAHGTLNIAMNRIGAKSDSGEGGEDRARYSRAPNGDLANSAIKQIASGRFGVDAEYLNQCREIEIKIAQGAKPGEGGQLPGFKVTKLIAKFRNSTPGVGLISPPPHHDIYSIEDLSQLIYDLKQINPRARVCVKLVAASGIGTIAVGVAKAMADVILVSGHNGGTGASPQTSIKYAGVPWEMGLSEVNQLLTLNNLRHRVVLRTDGGIRCGRDVVIAAMLGADEYGIGTVSLVAMGCIMVRQCHSNTCPVGVCVQDEKLRERFRGKPEHVVSLFTYIAEEIREILASLGMVDLNSVIGRSDLLHQISRGASNLDDLDFNPLLIQVDPGPHPRHCALAAGARNEVPDTLDAQITRDATPLFDRGEKMELAYTIRNTDRSIGARTSSHLVRKFGLDGLAPDSLTIKLTGSAGQSLGAFAVCGLRIEVSGEANDYVGKGLSGGVIIIKPADRSKIVTNENTIIGNTVLYGATAGKLYAAGQAGERFCVRNSGADAVVEGCGSNGCEYMTGGLVAILGPTGDNFAAGMSGGMAFVYDCDAMLEQRVNFESVVMQPVQAKYWQEKLKDLLRNHQKETGSPHALKILDDWGREMKIFRQICPKEMIAHLEHPLSDDLAMGA